MRNLNARKTIKSKSHGLHIHPNDYFCSQIFIMEHHQLEKLRLQLLNNKQWPLNYMFKFIVPNREGKVDQVVQLLPTSGKTSFRHTPNLQYVSVTCVTMMSTADEIITVTARINQIEGVIAL
jgi:hypothetical protein